MTAPVLPGEADRRDPEANSDVRVPSAAAPGKPAVDAPGPDAAAPPAPRAEPKALAGPVPGSPAGSPPDGAAAAVADLAVMATNGESDRRDAVVTDPAADREVDRDNGGLLVDVHADTNYGQLVGQLFEAVQRHSGAPLPPAWIHRELATYLPLKNEDKAAALLASNRVLVLVADQPGSGRWTGALRLLATAGDGDLTVRRIRRDVGDNFSMEGLRGHKRTAWILDLRDSEESLPASCDLSLELQTVQDLRDDGSYLAVLIGSRLWERVGHRAAGLAVVPEPPDRSELFVHCLRAYGVSHPHAFAEDHRFAKDLPQLRPGQVADWARTVAASNAQYRAATGRGTEPDSDDFEVVAKAAIGAVDGWMDALATWHADAQRTSYDRNYLLLAAVFDGAPIPEVHRKIASLAKEFGEKGERAEPLAGQQGPGLIQLARQINATSLPNGHIRFPGPGYAEAVVRYFWRDRPELIDAFTKWTAELCKSLKHPDGTRLAQRMAPWVLHHVKATRTTRLLHRIAADWSGDDNLAPHAHALLVAASLDPQVGQLTRRATETWMAKPDAPAPLLRTLAQVCQSLAPANPEKMLRRLGDLACSKQDGVAEAVGAAIDALWSDNDLRDRLHATVISWFESDQEPLHQAASSAFLNLAQQHGGGQPLLLREPGTPAADWVIAGWRTVLEIDEPSPLTHRAAYAWLDAAATLDRSTSDRILSALVKAVHDTPIDYLRGQRFLNLVRLSEHWMLKGEALDENGRNELRSDLMLRTQLADPHRPDNREEEFHGA